MDMEATHAQTSSEIICINLLFGKRHSQVIPLKHSDLDLLQQKQLFWKMLCLGKSLIGQGLVQLLSCLLEKLSM
jgi:hypothetical protein